MLHESLCGSPVARTCDVQAVNDVLRYSVAGVEPGGGRGTLLPSSLGPDSTRWKTGHAPRSGVDDYYLEAETAIAEFLAVNTSGEVGLTPDEYASWVNWINPLTGESMGKPRLAGATKQGSRPQSVMASVW